MSEYILSIEDARDVVKQLRTAARSCRQRERTNAEACCDWLADGIEAQIPKPPEPTGLGAVVEDAKGHRWTCVGAVTGCWVPDGGGLEGRLWDRIDAVKVLSQGVTS